jgi:hypothetical protein
LVAPPKPAWLVKETVYHPEMSLLIVPNFDAGNHVAEEVAGRFDNDVRR